MRPAHCCAPLLAALLVAACASSPNASPQERTVVALRQANAAYEETMITVGRVRRLSEQYEAKVAAGQQTDRPKPYVNEAQYEGLIAKGEKVEKALKTAYAGIGAWLVVGEGYAAAVLSDVNKALAELLSAWGEHGH